MADILVDGYNVIKNNALFQAMEIQDFSYARTLLVKQLHNRYRQTPHNVIAVFDGNGTHEQVNHYEHIHIIFSQYNETADSVIARLAAEAKKAGREVAMYSDDEEVRHAVAEQGGSTHTTHQLTERLNAPPRDVAIRSAHRQAMRRIYGIDPVHKLEDEQETQRVSGKKRKKASRHRK